MENVIDVDFQKSIDFCDLLDSQPFAKTGIMHHTIEYMAHVQQKLMKSRGGFIKLAKQLEEEQSEDKERIEELRAFAKTAAAYAARLGETIKLCREAANPAIEK